MNQLVDGNQAQKWLEDCHYEGQRAPRPDHVKYLAEEMQCGTFLQGTPIHFAECNGSKYLVNGQHTLRAIVRCGIPQELTVIHLPCKTMEDVAIAYGVIDTQLKRSASDMFSAMGLRDELGLNHTQLNKLYTAVKLIRVEFAPKSTKTIHNSEVVSWIRSYSVDAKKYFNVVSNAPQTMRNGLYRGVTVALGVVTFRYSAKKYTETVVENFWNGVAFDDGIKNNDPRKPANTHILTTNFSGGGLSQSRKNVVSESYSARYIANCFNAFVEKRELTRTQVKDSNTPIFICGSPFDGRDYGKVW